MNKLPSRKDITIAAISVLLTLLLNNLFMTAGTKIYATNDGRTPTPTEEPVSEELLAAPARTGVEPRSASKSVGMYTSLALTSSNLPVISYYDSTNGDLKLAVCTDAACTSPAISTLDSTGVVGKYTSIAVTSSNLPVISYYDETNGNLKLAVCTNAACTSYTISTLDSPGAVVGKYTSIAVTSSNLPVISYYDETNQNLKLALCNNADCKSSTISTRDSTDNVGSHTSIAVTSSNLPVISYYDETNQNLKLYVAPVTVDDGKPNSFAKSTPTNNAIVSSSTAILTWSSAVNIDRYEVCIATTTTGCTTWTSTGTSTTASRTGLSHNTIYYWHVRAINAAGTTYADSNSFSKFTAFQLPAGFSLTSPANNATNQSVTVTLRWNASTRATSYEYCVALTQAACTNWKSTGTNTTVTASGLSYRSTYFWQVRAINAGGATISSGGGYRSFTTQTRK